MNINLEYPLECKNNLCCQNVFPTNMDQTVHLIVVIAKMESHVSQKAEFAPMVAKLDGSVIFV